METISEMKNRRPRRSKADIEAAIQRAAVAQIKKKGFSLALVTDIVKRAKIEPVVFYNRYKNLDEFYDKFVKQYDYWLSTTIHKLSNSLDTPEGYSKALEEITSKLISDTVMTELLRWEISEGTHITERTAQLREMDVNGIITKYESNSNETDIIAVSALIVAGIFFMVLHKDRSTFAGIDINSPEGRKRINQAFSHIADRLFASVSERRRRLKLTECLRREGLSPEAIERCLKECAL